MIFEHEGQWYKVLVMTPISEKEARERQEYHARTGHEQPPVTEIVHGGKVTTDD